MNDSSRDPKKSESDGDGPDRKTDKSKNIKDAKDVLEVPRNTLKTRSIIYLNVTVTMPNLTKKIFTQISLVGL